MTGSRSGGGSPPSPPPTPRGGVCPAGPGTGSGSLVQRSGEKGAPGRRHGLGRQRAFCPGSLLPRSGLSSNAASSEGPPAASQGGSLPSKQLPFLLTLRAVSRVSLLPCQLPRGRDASFLLAAVPQGPAQQRAPGRHWRAPGPCSLPHSPYP